MATSNALDVESMIDAATKAARERVMSIIPAVQSAGEPVDHAKARAAVIATNVKAEKIDELNEDHIRASADFFSELDDFDDVETRARASVEKENESNNSHFTPEMHAGVEGATDVETKIRGQLRRVGDQTSDFGLGINNDLLRDVKPTNKLFRPRGNIAGIFYDQRVTTGLAGPAGTGKSRGILEKLHIICEKYPGARVLICRKTRESLTEAALMTYEEQVLPPSHPALMGPKRSHRQSYFYPNGSVINVCGLDKPQKIMSTEYDIVYVQEAIECDEEDFQLLSTRIRNGVVPYQQILFDCNPDAPTHWIYQNSIAGKLDMVDTEHEDNPRWFEAAPHTITATCNDWPIESKSGVIGRWTRDGLSYISKLDNLSGARYQRLRWGKWVSAEGQIYDDFDQTHHVVDRFNPRRDEGHWIWTVDFGWSKPFSLQVYWINPDGMAFLWGEIYKTQKLVEEHAADALAMCGLGYDPETGHYELVEDEDGNPIYCTGLPTAIICDHDAEGRATLELHLGIKTTPATKAILEGIDAVKARMKVQVNGLPRIQFMRGTLYEEDADLKDKLQPLSLIQEFSSYIWRKAKTVSGNIGKKEQPVDEWNHAMDALRYLVCYLDGITGGNDPKGRDVAQMMAGPTVRIFNRQKDNGQATTGRHMVLITAKRDGMSRADKVAARKAERHNRRAGTN